VALAYGFKWVWAPLVDRLPLPLLAHLLGRRRSWLLLAQLAVAGGLIGMAYVDPAQSLAAIVWFAMLVAFASATQDIVIDAFRIESGGTRLQAAMAATYMIGYRLAMIVAGAGVLWLAAWVDPEASVYHPASWQFAYLTMAALMGIGVLTTLIVAEPHPVPGADVAAASEPAGLSQLSPWLRPAARWIWSAVLSPFIDFFARHGWLALLVLALIASYRISDIVLGVIANVFYVDTGFSKTEVANVTKVFGVAMTLLGAVVGGILVNRLGVMRILFAGAVLSAATNLLFALLAQVGASVPLLIGVVAMDNLSGGLAASAFVAYLSALTNVRYSATQYALFSSVMLLLPKFLGGFSGVMVDRLGYESFFLITALMGLPVLLLVWFAGRYTQFEARD
jgi:PAT family beta-lactamase induction signal transducer AmpG